MFQSIYTLQATSKVMRNQFANSSLLCSSWVQMAHDDYKKNIVHRLRGYVCVFLNPKLFASLINPLAQLYRWMYMHLFFSSSLFFFERKVTLRVLFIREINLVIQDETVRTSGSNETKERETKKELKMTKTSRV